MLGEQLRGKEQWQRALAKSSGKQQWQRAVAKSRAVSCVRVGTEFIKMYYGSSKTIHGLGR